MNCHASRTTIQNIPVIEREIRQRLRRFALIYYTRMKAPGRGIAARNLPHWLVLPHAPNILLSYSALWALVNEMNVKMKMKMNVGDIADRENKR